MTKRTPRQRGFLQLGTDKVNDQDSLSGDFLKVTMLNYTIFFALFSPVLSIIEYLIHVEDPDPTFANNNLIFLLFSSTFLVLLLFMRIKLVKPGYYAQGIFRRFRGNEVVLIQSIIGFMSVLSVWFLTWFVELVAKTLEIMPVEIFLFYVNAGIAEEILYRMFGITMVKIGLFLLFKVLGILQGKKNKKIKFTFINITAVGITSIIFMVSHLGVYGNQPIILLSTLFAGIVFGTLYVVFKNNPLPGMIGHVFNNMIAAGFIISGV